MAKSLTSFAVTGAGDDYVLMIEDEDGETIEFAASYDQLAEIIEAIEAQIDDDAEEVEAIESGEIDE